MRRWTRGLLRRAVPWWGGLGLYSLLIFVLSSRPLPDGPDLEFEHADKAIHASVYGLWTLLFVQALSRSAPRLHRGVVAFSGFLTACLYGLSDEFHQSFVPARTADLLDLVADAVGAMAAAALWWWVGARVDRARAASERRPGRAKRAE